MKLLSSASLVARTWWQIPTNEIMNQSLESIKLEFIQEVMSEQSYDTLKEWLYMHEEARYVASLTSNEPELIEFNKNFEKSIKEGFMKSHKWLLSDLNALNP